MIAKLRSRGRSLAMGATLGAAFTLQGAGMASSQDATAAEPVTMFVTLPIRAEVFDDFLEVMQANAQASREEPGNIAFDVYRLEEGGSDIFLFEQWEDAAALDAHGETDHLAAVIARTETDLSGPVSTVDLIELSPPVEPAEIASPATTRNVLVSLHLRPEARDAFVEALLDTVEPSRNAPGNLGFDVYQDIEDPNAIVLVERWESAAAHEAHLEQDYNAPLNAVFAESIAQPLVDGPDGRRLTQDISGD